MNPEVELRRCANPLCKCHVDHNDNYCSEACRIGSGYQCSCQHLACSGAPALVWQSEAPTFYGGRLL